MTSGALSELEAGPVSHIVRTAPVSKMSKRLWGLDWSSQLPWELEDISVVEGTFADAFPFMAEHYPVIFGVDRERFLVEEMTDAKRRFWDEMDVFVFASEGRTVGVAAGHPADWSTYYVRTFAILPEFRERRFATGFAKALSVALRDAGITRFEAECSPANTAMVRLFSSDGFLVTGTSNSERWGTTLRFTKFLREDAATAYRQQFINVPAFGRDPQPK